MHDNLTTVYKFGGLQTLRINIVTKLNTSLRNDKCNVI